MPDILVGLVRFSEPKNMVIETIGALLSQENINLHILLVDQSDDPISNSDIVHSSSNLKIFAERFSGLSAAKNFIIKNRTSDYVIFLDWDARPIAVTWARSFLDFMLLNPQAGIVFSKVLNVYPKNNLWFLLKSRIICEFFSHVDLWAVQKNHKRAIGGNTCINFGLIWTKFFNESLGRKPWSLNSGEDTLFSLEVSLRFPIFYSPEMPVAHFIDGKKINFLWICRRVYHWARFKWRYGTKIESYCVNNIQDKASLILFVPIYFLWFFVWKVSKLFTLFRKHNHGFWKTLE